MILGELILSIKDGCQQAFCRFYDITRPNLLYKCLKVAENNMEVALENMHDGYISFFNKIGEFTYENDAGVYRYLTTTMMHASFAQKRKKYLRVVHKEYEELEKIAENIVLDPIDTKEICMLADSLPELYRDMFYLGIYSDLDHKEIAEILGISEANSRFRLYATKIRLQKILIANGYGKEYAKVAGMDGQD